MPASARGELGDWVLTGLPGLLVSRKFKNALDAAGVKNVQYIRAEILDEVSGKTHPDYFVANVIGRVDCINMARSKLTMMAGFPDQIRDIDELHIDEARAAGHDMFRLARYEQLVLVEERVKARLSQGALSGVGFVEANGFSI